MICVLRDGPHLVNGSPKLITRSQSSDSRIPLRRQVPDRGDRTGIAPISRVEAALSALLNSHVPDSALLGPAEPTYSRLCSRAEGLVSPPETDGLPQASIPSASRISPQRPTQPLGMYRPGPAINLLTSPRILPQKEHLGWPSRSDFLRAEKRYPLTHVPTRSTRIKPVPGPLVHVSVEDSGVVRRSGN